MSGAAYSPRLRTALVFCGAGTAGAYQAGVLKAVTEAGAKIDVIAAHGPGVLTALAGGIDGGARLWDPAGVWTSPRLRAAYRWRPSLRAAGWGLVVAGAVLLTPLLILVLASLAYGASLAAALVHLPNASAWLVEWYGRTLGVLFQPPIIPAIVPGILVLAFLVVLGVLAAAAVGTMRSERSRRRMSGAFWWRLIGAPMDAEEPGASLVDTLWQLVRGASSAPKPMATEIGRRYVELLTENLGQPGFREVIVAVHDLDARRDVVGGVLAGDARAAFEARRKGAGPREMEMIDFSGPQRALVVDFVIGALRLPVAAAPHAVQFPADSFWRGELHRLSDRPELAARLIEEVAGIGVEQVILVSAAPPAAGPHALRSRPVDLAGRMGEVLRSIETAAFDDAGAAAAARFSGVFLIRPGHNPIGPFDFGGVYDESSDRRWGVADLLQQGYDDAYRQFIEPVVASGEKMEL